MEKKMLSFGVFCKVYGDTPRNRVMEHFLALRESDIQVSEFISLLGLTKPTVYSVINNVVKEGLIIKSRIVGRTQLYKLNKNNEAVKILIKSFDDCLKYNLEEFKDYQNQKYSSFGSSRVVAISAKHY